MGWAEVVHEQISPIEHPFNIERLEKRHQRLKQKVAEYEERLALTSGEEMQLQKLKKQKLRTKDELNAIKA